MLRADVADFLESGVSMLVGTRDDALLPESTRAMGARVDPDSGLVTVYVPVATSERTVANLRANGRIAVTFSRPVDHKTFQIKGDATVRDARDDERIVVDMYRAAFAVQLDLVGLPRSVTLRYAHWPAWAVDVRVTDTFGQTPGPNAGQRLPA